MKSNLLTPVFLASALYLCSHSVLAVETPPLDAKQVDQVKTIVHDYLVTNPQVLMEASQALQKQQMQKMEDQAKVAIIKGADKIFADPNSPVSGNPKGKVTVVEFFDYQCPHCKEMKSLMDKLTTENSDLRVVYKELPIFGATSRDAAAAALASVRQGKDKYMKLHDALLSAENPLNKDKLMAAAKTAGLDTDKLSKDMQDPAIQKQLDDNMQLAQDLNLIGTPSFVVNKWEVGGKNEVKDPGFIPGVATLEDLKAKIDAAQKS